MAIQAKVAAATRPNVNPDDEAQYFQERLEHERQMARIRQAMGTSQSRFEAMGVNVKGVKRAIRLANSDNAQAEHRRDTETFIRLGIITVEDNGQGSFIQGLKVAMPGPVAVKGIALARAHADGYNSGRSGAAIDNCSHPPGSEEFVKWRDGWDDGRRDLLLRNPNADKVTEATPRQRGRPPGSKNHAVEAAPAGPSTVSSGPKPRGRPKKVVASVAGDDGMGEPAGNA